MIFICRNPQIAQKGSQVTTLSRHELWKEGHVNKEGQIDNENVQQVWDRCVSNIFLNCKLSALIFIYFDSLVINNIYFLMYMP